MLPKRAIMEVGTMKTAPAKPKVVSEDEDTDTRAPEPEPDRRKVQFLRGKLLRIDCSSAPTALLSVSAGTKTWKLRVEDTHSLLLIGATEFSCDWKSLPVTVNYKAGGKSDGDIVSLEIRQ
jgi:hypothetical protein